MRCATITNAHGAPGRCSGMSVTIVPNPPVTWDVYWASPYLRSSSTAFSSGAAEDQYVPTYAPDATNSCSPRLVWEYGQGGTGATGSRIRYNGILVIERSTTVVPAIKGMNGINFQTIQDRTALPPGYVNPSMLRVNWLTFQMAMDVGTLDRLSGFLLSSQGGTQTAAQWPTNPPALVFGSGFGITGDGAGNWNWESFEGAPPSTVLESVSLAPFIPDASKLTTFDYVMIGATGERPASFQLRINQELAIERNWETGVVLPFMPAAATRWSPIMQVATPSGDRMLMGNWEWKMGRFLPDGRELFE